MTPLEQQTRDLLAQLELGAWRQLGGKRNNLDLTAAILRRLFANGVSGTAVVVTASGAVVSASGELQKKLANVDWLALDDGRKTDALRRAGWPETDLPVATIQCATEAGRQGALVVGPASPVVLERARVLARPLAVVLARELEAQQQAQVRAGQGYLDRTTPNSGSEANVVKIVGMTGGLRDVVAQVERVAATPIPILILGETGAGKELLARLIHERSPRRNGPIVRVNCGAIPPELVDSELFGHERGSFTGAVQARRGWFERADGGTLFLDEVGELPPAAQVRLLRVLQDGEFERVGGHETRHADVRIVAATHRDLPVMVRDGQFREDLWYRLSVFPLRLPPLRERLGDLPALARHFAAQAGGRLGWSGVQPTDADIQELSAYDWPGNVRELAAVVERAVLLGHGQRLDLRAAFALDTRIPASTPAPAAASTLEQSQVQQIEEALRHTRGRIEGAGGAAERLAVNPHTLRARMRKFGIDWSTFRLG